MFLHFLATKMFTGLMHASHEGR